jgi:hypothetical protein
MAVCGSTGAHAQVLGHPLGEPEGVVQPLRRLLQPAPGAPGAGDVVLEGVHQLVPQHVVRLLDGAAEGLDDALLEHLRHAAGALAQVAGDGVLLEVRGAGVQDQRLAVLELVVQDAREPRVPPLHLPGRVARGDFLFRVEVHVEVRRPQDAEVELAVLHLVLPEVLRGRGRCVRRRGYRAHA